MSDFFKGVRAGVPLGLIVSAAMALTLSLLILFGRAL